ncbi:phosphotransferase enzyme family protein [Rhizobium sp. L1K21]|uniref:phosphotransferase enzyme family protein n=1 Tax=Rhizobium sp. L1K21 TaxID=2954933 RepID=UPI002092361E|nr:phosphotransferase [Rhizobium sp. L1K21]MCO6187901.1 phosphotransferase [Rhizobium sp. L1K21]
MSDLVEAALALWGVTGNDCEFVAGRENRVYRVRTSQGDFALRIKRPGYREMSELNSELQWLDAMEKSGLHVPLPLPSRNGRFLECIDSFYVDMVSWLPGKPLGKSRHPLELHNRSDTFYALGAEMAKMHAACDEWQRPDGFHRCDWDLEGLLGESPLWGRFWDNPTLPKDTRELFVQFRSVARDRIAELSSGLDYGLIHADLVRENVLLDGKTIKIIDFDDGGFGYRLFDIATVLSKNMAEPDYSELKSALIEGYLNRRALNIEGLDVFITMRALTYVGWIVPRIHETGGELRNERFVSEAKNLCISFFNMR